MREPVFDETVGEGVHHVAVATPNFDDAVAEQAERGHDPVLSGTFGGVELAYLPTDHHLGAIVDIFGGTPDDRPQPDETA